MTEPGPSRHDDKAQAPPGADGDAQVHRVPPDDDPQDVERRASRFTPRRVAVFLILALAYLVMPIDLIPDVFPPVGWIDDVAILPLLAWLVFRWWSHRRA